MTWQPHMSLFVAGYSGPWCVEIVIRGLDFGPGACEPAAALRTEMRLWVPETDGIHVQTRPRTGRSQSGAGDPPPEQAPGPRQRHARPMRRPDPGRRNAAPPPPVAYHYGSDPFVTRVIRSVKKLARATADPAGRYKQDREFIHCRGTGGRFVGPCGTEYRRRTRLRSSILRTVADRDRALANESARRHGAKRHLLTSRV